MFSVIEAEPSSEIQPLHKGSNDARLESRENVTSLCSGLGLVGQGCFALDILGASQVCQKAFSNS